MFTPVTESTAHRVMSSPDTRPVAVDLFCGAGGMSLGFEQAGFDVLAAVDHDPIHLAVHTFNFPITEPLCQDIREVSSTTIGATVSKAWSAFDRSGEWDGSIDCLFGGPSCQGFSSMGRLDYCDERNSLLFEFARLVEECRPRTFVLENVPGLAAFPHRTTLAHLYRRLGQAGYAMQKSTPIQLDAADYGVPQHRKRLFIIGARDGISVAIPDPVISPTVADALDDLPEVELYASLMTDDQIRLSHTEHNVPSAKLSSYANSLRSRFSHEYTRTWDVDILTGCKRTTHSDNVRARFEELAPGAEDTPSRTLRLQSGGQSRTLRAGTGRDHGSFTAPRPVHHRTARVITVREAARLHSFPDWFQLHATKWHGLRQIGNSVPPRLAGAVAAEVAKALGRDPITPQLALPASDDALLTMSLQAAADHFSYPRDLLPYDVRRQPGHRGRGR